MHKCRTHNVDYEDFCVLCSGTPLLHKKLKAFVWLALLLAFLTAFFIYTFKLFS